MTSALARKLHLKPGMTMCVLDAPAGYQLELASIDVTHKKAPKGPLDVLQVFVTRKAQLDKRLPAIKAAMTEKSALWVCYPKANGLDTDLNRDILRLGLADKGLTAVAQIAIDAVWSALRFKLSVEVDRAPRVIEPPRDLMTAMRKNASARARWKTWSYTHQKELVDWITSAKRSETRERRIDKALAMLER
jgi:hypothetical protein